MSDRIKKILEVAGKPARDSEEAKEKRSTNLRKMLGSRKWHAFLDRSFSNRLWADSALPDRWLTQGFYTARTIRLAEEAGWKLMEVSGERFLIPPDNWQEVADANSSTYRKVVDEPHKLINGGSRKGNRLFDNASKPSDATGTKPSISDDPIFGDHERDLRETLDNLKDLRAAPLPQKEKIPTPLRGDENIETYVELVMEAKPGKEGLTEFLSKLEERFPGLYQVLKNMTRPKNGIRLQQSQIAEALSEREANVSIWKTVLSVLCSRLNWNEVKIKKSRSLFQHLAQQAEPEKKGLKKFIRLLKRNGLQTDAIILENMIWREKKRRLSQIELSKKISIRGASIGRRELIIYLLFHNFDWGIMERDSIESLKLLAKRFDPREVGIVTLLDEARKRGMVNIAKVVENLSKPEGEKRLSASQLVRDPAVTIYVGTVYKWNRALTPILREWGIHVGESRRVITNVKRQDALDNNRRRTAIFRELVSEIKSGEKGLTEFLEMLEEAPKLHAILENMTRPEGGKPTTKAELAEELTITEGVLSRWMLVFRVLCKRHNWPMIGGKNWKTHLLLAQARPKKDGLTDLLELLRENNYLIQAKVLENLTRTDRKKRLNQVHLASQLDTSPQLVSKWEFVFQSLYGHFDWGIDKTRASNNRRRSTKSQNRTEETSDVRLMSDPFLVQTLWHLGRTILPDVTSRMKSSAIAAAARISRSDSPYLKALSRTFRSLRFFSKPERHR